VELSQALKEALRRLLEGGPVKVQENGSWLAPLENFQYEVREKAGATVLHLWTQEGTLVRRVIAIDANNDDRLALQGWCPTGKSSVPWLRLEKRSIRFGGSTRRRSQRNRCQEVQRSRYASEGFSLGAAGREVRSSGSVLNRR
jgi:hypothetical protein